MPAAKAPFWTPEHINTLTLAYGAGTPVSEIITALGGGLTRNQVIGKAHRLGLGHARPRGAKHGSRKRGSTSTPKVKAQRRQFQPRVERPERLKNIPPEPEAQFTLLTLPRLGCCRWPQGTGPYVFCGAAVHSASSPYCLHHAMRASLAQIGAHL